MEINRAIEVLKTLKDCRKKYSRMRPYPRTCDKCIHADKCYTLWEEDKSLELAIAALERQEKELCESCEWREFPPCPAKVVGGKCSFESMESVATEHQDKMKQGCNICNSDEIEKLLIMNFVGIESLAFIGGNSKFPKENHAKFCPKCGRKLEG